MLQRTLPWCCPPMEIRLSMGGEGHLWATARLCGKRKVLSWLHVPGCRGWFTASHSSQLATGLGTWGRFAKRINPSWWRRAPGKHVLASLEHSCL